MGFLVVGVMVKVVIMARVVVVPNLNRGIRSGHGDPHRSFPWPLCSIVTAPSQFWFRVLWLQLLAGTFHPSRSKLKVWRPPWLDWSFLFGRSFLFGLCLFCQYASLFAVSQGLLFWLAFVSCLFVCAPWAPRGFPEA